MLDRTPRGQLVECRIANAGQSCMLGIARNLPRAARQLNQQSPPHPMSQPTLFEKICTKEIPAAIVHEDHLCVAFRDIAPQAPVHILIVPRKPLPRLGLAEAYDQAMLGHLLLTAAALARREGLAESGYRLVINNGPDGGEAVPHLHLHLLGGRQLGWPPG